MSSDVNCPRCDGAVGSGNSTCGNCGERIPRSLLLPSMSASGVLSQTFEVIGRHFGTLFGIVFVVHLPWLLLTLYSLTLEVGSSTSMVVASAALVLQVLLGTLTTAVVIYAVFQVLRGREAPLGDCLRRGGARLLPALGVSFVVSILTMVGFLLFIIPGIILMLMLYVAIPVVVVERVGIGRALSRSAELTKDRRMSILGLVILVGLVNMIPGGIGALLSMAGGAVFGPLVEMFISLVVGLISSLIYSVAVSTTYHDLRVDKEGIDTETLASVFD